MIMDNILELSSIKARNNWHVDIDHNLYLSSDVIGPETTLIFHNWKDWISLKIGYDINQKTMTYYWHRSEIPEEYRTNLKLGLKILEEKNLI